MPFPEAPSLDAAGQPTAPETSSDNAPSREESHQDTRRTDAPETAAQQAYELEKLGKFRFQGQDWTAKDLEKAILRQKDYTQKTQKFAEERKSYETSTQEDLKYYKNLSWDIQAVLNDPSLAAEFIKTYPQKFHVELRDALTRAGAQGARGQQGQSNQNMRASAHEIDLMSRLQALEGRDHEANVQRNEKEINQTVESLGKKYPDALPELAIGRAFEAHNAGVKLTPETWEGIFKDADRQMKDLVKQRYGNLVTKQMKANAKGRADDAGGAAVGRAPPKAKTFKQATELMINDLKSRR